MTDLAAGLTTADAARLSALVEAAETTHAALCAADAEHTRTLADLDAFAEHLTAGSPLSVRERDMARRTVASEAAVALRQSDRGIQARMHDAHTLVTDYPATVALWEAGRISRGHVHAVTAAGVHLPVEDRQAFDASAAAVCEKQSVPRARDTLNHLAERMHPRTPTERHRDARETRRVWVEMLGDGMSRVCAEVPTILGEGIHDRVERIAAAIIDERAAARVRVRDARAAGVPENELDPGDCNLSEDARTTAQIRADVFADLLLAGQPGFDPTAQADGHGELGAIRAHVQVVVAATTLMGADEQAADLVGVAPVDAATARQLAGNCTGFDRLLTHPISGQILTVDRYTPTLDLRRRLRARDRHCRFPGCRVPAIRCEMDHTVDHALGGRTCLTNLAELCQRHHTMKQFTPWRVRQLGDGVLEWTSPTGRIYIDEPPTPLVFFAPDDGSPPPF